MNKVSPSPYKVSPESEASSETEASLEPKTNPEPKASHSLDEVTSELDIGIDLAPK